MALRSPSTARFRGAVLGACGALVLCACHDASQDPLAVILTEETRAALAVRTGLPSLAGLAARAGVEDGVDASVDLWMESWEKETPEGRALRAEAYTGAAPRLAEALGREGVAAVVVDVGEAVAAVSTLEPASLPDELALDYGRVVGLHRDAVDALDAGEPAPALAAALEAADALREVGPHSIARSLVSRADAKLEAVRARPGTAPAAWRQGDPELDLERAERLLRGARLALEDEDWTRALRRAYYACQLLGVAPR